MSDENVRVFCTADKIPSIDEVVSFVKSRGIQLDITPYSEIDSGSSSWSSVYLRSVEEEKNTFQVQLITPSNEDMNELGDFIDIISDDAEGLQGQKKVLQHLEATRYYIRISLLPDLNEKALKAIAQFLMFFTTYCGGMIQNDAEGFYQGRKLLLKFVWKS